MAKQSVGLDIGLQEAVRLRAIPDIPKIYKAGSDGRIYSYSNARTNAKKAKPFKLAMVKNNAYYVVTLCKTKIPRSYTVHSLICSAFHGRKPFPRACVRHLDGDWANNNPSNLKWGTYAENEADKRRHGRIARGEKQGSAKLTEEAVKIIRASIPKGLWNSKNAAEVFGVSQSTIMQIARGRNWKHVK